MVYITGDCHADFYKFDRVLFPEQDEMTRDDFVIVCGDFGIWHDTWTEKETLQWLSQKNFTLLFVDGNHENFDRLYSDEFPVVDFHGGKAQQVRENIFHLMRGYVYELCGKKFFAFGGASSHDIQDGILEPADYETTEALREAYRDWSERGRMFRINHLSWWKEELPSEEEMAFGLRTLSEHGNSVDYIITHCCPQNLAAYFSRGMYKPDALTKYFDGIAENVQFEHWYFGHYHHDERYFEKYTCLFDDIERVL